MRNRYKAPAITTLAFFAVWPQVPHVVWLTCEMLPDCNNESSHISGLNFFGTSASTNLFDVVPEEPAGFLMLGVSFACMGVLALWRIKK